MYIQKDKSHLNNKSSPQTYESLNAPSIVLDPQFARSRRHAVDRLSLYNEVLCVQIRSRGLPTIQQRLISPAGEVCGSCSRNTLQSKLLLQLTHHVLHKHKY